MASLITRSAVKQFILDRAKILRPGWNATRVSESSLEFAEARLRNVIDESLRRQPSNGQTVKLD